MDPLRLIRLPAVIHHLTAGPTDEYGTATPTVSATTTTRAWVHQTTATEDTVDTARQSSTWRGYLPASVAAALTGHDRLTVDGRTFDIVGPPWPARHPRTAAVTHLELTLTLTV